MNEAKKQEERNARPKRNAMRYGNFEMDVM